MPLTVILDVDGTLVDNTYFHVLAWWYACRDHGIPATMAVLHRLVGMGGDQFVPALVGRDMPELDEAHGRHFSPHLEEVPVLAGASEFIAELHRRGATVAIATSSTRSDLDVVLAKLPSAALLDHVVSKEDVGTTKPAPDLPLVAMRRSDAEPDACIFVGDTRWDVEAAGRAGIRCVTVRSGGWSEQELRDCGAVEVHDDVGAILATLDENLIGARLRDA